MKHTKSLSLIKETEIPSDPNSKEIFPFQQKVKMLLNFFDMWEKNLLEREEVFKTTEKENIEKRSARGMPPL
jgi:hypothetical protein